MKREGSVAYFSGPVGEIDAADKVEGIKNRSLPHGCQRVYWQDKLQPMPCSSTPIIHDKEGLGAWAPYSCSGTGSP